MKKRKAPILSLEEITVYRKVNNDLDKWRELSRREVITMYRAHTIALNSLE